MGLDWRPMNKPHKGQEEEYRKLFKILSGKQEQKLGFFDKLRGKKLLSKDEILDQFLSMSSSAYETLEAPQVGIDDKATAWAEEKYENRTNKNLTIEEFINEMKGYYVVDLVPECDGIPVYIALHDEAHIFRGKFLNTVQDVIGDNLLERAYETKLAEETLAYSSELMSVAENYASKHDCMEVKEQRRPPEGNENSPAYKAHIIFSAAKWLQYWGSRGHGMEADY